MNAKEYSDYDTWNTKLTTIIKKWEALEKESTQLEMISLDISEEKVGFHVTSQATAYTKEEISNVFDKAPAGKKIATLAKHIGVDAKMAQLILNQSQDYVTREAYGEEGDVFQTCENNAMRIKNGAKVTVFVGTIVATGGTSALAASGTLAQTAVVISGADLALEVTEDEARIAMGDNNKVTQMASSVRTITEPAASILTIATMPSNLAKAGEKFAAGNFGAEQIRSVIQDKKIVGISIKVASDGQVNSEIAGLTEEEFDKWKSENNAPNSTQTIQEILGLEGQDPVELNNKQQVEIEVKENEGLEKGSDKGNAGEVTSPSSVQSMAGTYSGSATLVHVEEDVEADDSLPVTLQLNESGAGTANVYGFDGDAYYAGNTVNFSVTMKENGAVVKCVFDGKSSKSGNQTMISGNMPCSMMGITFATYSWSAQK
jgi:hypothetical protein